MSAATYAVTEKVAYGRDPSLGETLKVGFISGVTAGVTQYVGQELGLIQCFIAGTIVATKEGPKKIEDIQPGDFVWATDPNTGETDLKEVKQLFRNETDEWIHITVNDEEIVCTPNHPFWVPVKGWTKACHLRAGDRLQLLNGEYVVVEQVQHEILERPETTYNFEVEDLHTYFVGESGVLVHNSCKHNSAWTKERRSFWKNTSQTAIEGQNYGAYTASADNITRMSKGLAPIGWDGKSVQLHHWQGISVDFYDYSPVSATLHRLIHSIL